ncbi:hypothetical protein OG601_01685 [Streptomyces sp. NBC_01239]|uniref:hypothetical protein n=1 Tax=Streptomyces sp. NBC_01239 TaxID=2903792 RepID=UPI0022580193|nr:hypothetical protein [Streptomyces sp. NBC_01239]MCX4809333.1 hypothetical protein [Streptomyces sp. NBC_01239]
MTPRLVGETDPRPASPVQEAHIAYALASAGEGPLPRSWLGIDFGLPPALDSGAFATALREMTGRHECPRSRLLPVRPASFRRETLPPGATTVHGADLGKFDGGAQLATHA